MVNSPLRRSGIRDILMDFGKPELRFTGVGYRNNLSSTFKAFEFVKTPSRSTAKSDYTLNAYMFNWYFDDIHGPDYYFQAIEEDNSGTQLKLTVSVSVGIKENVTGQAGFEINYRAQDKLLYGQSITYMDSEPRTYTSSDYLYFGLNNN